MRRHVRLLVAPALATVVASAAIAMTSLMVAPAGAVDLASSVQAGTLAIANVGKGAGTCSTANPATNSLGGTAFRSSCHGYAGLPEFWCADFAAWVWDNSGLYVAGITASAATFVTSGAGTVHTDPSYVPQVGDAVVFNYDGGSYADHVGLVGAVNPDGSVVTINGDFGGRGSGAHFARTSLVRSVTIRASSRSVGSTPGHIGMTITDYVTPRPVPASSPTASVARPWLLGCSTIRWPEAFPMWRGSRPVARLNVRPSSMGPGRHRRPCRRRANTSPAAPRSPPMPVGSRTSSGEDRTAGSTTTTS